MPEKKARRGAGRFGRGVGILDVAGVDNACRRRSKIGSDET